MGFGRSIIGDRFTDQVLTGTDNAEKIISFVGNDTIVGGAGDDLIRAGFGDDRINGGAGADRIFGDHGVDTAVYAGNLAEYTIKQGPGPFASVTDANGVSDLLHRVEILEFADQSVFIDGRDNAPVAGADVATIGASSALQLTPETVLANDTDFDGDAIVVSGVAASSTKGGTVIFDSGVITYTPGEVFSTLPVGETTTDSFTYTIEANGATATGTVTVTIEGTYVPAPVEAKISEIRPNPAGSDPKTQTVELSGKPGETFSGWLISVEGDNASGVIDRASEISGTFDANGILTATIPDLENPGFTLILTDSFTGAKGDSILPNGGTTPDMSAFGTIQDAIGVPDGSGDTVFGAALGGSDLAAGAEPELLFRDGSTGDLYAVVKGEVVDAARTPVPASEFSTDPTVDSFGTANPTLGAAPVAAKISEIQPNPAGQDPSTQKVELSGTPGASFDGWLLSIESDAGSSQGRVDRAVQISGVFDANGLLTAEIADLENPTFTLVLTDGFTGDTSTDIDPANDGTASDLSALGTVLDAVGVTDKATDPTYGAALGGEDLSYIGSEPQLIFREGSVGDWVQVDYNGKAYDAAATALDVSRFNSDPTALTFEAVNPAQTPEVPALVINEVLADPASGTDGDANGDGNRHYSDDEFAEIVNSGAKPADLSGMTLSDGASVRHVFADGTTLEPGQAIVVFGGGTPTGDFAGAQVVTASTGALGLNNSGDTVTLAKDGATVAEMTYGSEGGNNASLTLFEDLVGTYQLHTEVSTDRFSPGSKVDGSSFDGGTTGPSVTLISQVQGEGLESQMVGDTVTVQGIVVGDFQTGDADTLRQLKGFYVQEEANDSDGNAKTSEGIFIYDPALLKDVSLGDKVTVTGKVGEHYGNTQLTASEVVIDQAGAVADVKTMAATVDLDAIPDVQGKTANLEAVEGMIVTFPETLTVTEAYNLDRFNEVRLTSGDRPQQFTQGNEPSVEGYQQHLTETFSDIIVFDDGLSVQNAPIFPEADLNGDGKFTTADGFGMGDTINGLTGVVDYSFSSFRVRSVDDSNSFVDTQTRSDTPPIVSVQGDTKLTATSFNVLNFFTTLDQNGNTAGPSGLEPRGADNPEEYARQLDKLLTTLTKIDSDLFDLIELENEFQSDQNGDGKFAIEAIVDGLNSKYGAGTWAWADPGRAFVDTGDAISVGIIYKTASVSLVEGSVKVLDDAAVDATGFAKPYALFDGPSTNRAPIAATFTDLGSGQDFTVAVTHMKSKGSVNPDGNNTDAGDGAGANDEIRTLGVKAVTHWLDSTREGAFTEEKQLVMGDFNAYAKEDPIDAMKDAGYANLEETLGGNADTFVFDGQTGTLDYVFASSEMASSVTRAAAWEINSNEPDAIDYNTDYGRNTGIFAGDVAYRSSDHDPMIVEFDLNPLLA